MVGPQRPQFVLFGSSIVQRSFSNGGWGSILADIYARKADILLRGYDGWNSRRAIQVLDKIFPKDAAMQPALVIVYFGGNDSVRPFPSGLSSPIPLQESHVPLLEYVENMRKIAKHVMSLSESIRLIFLTPPPVNEAQIQGNMSPFSGERIRTNNLIQKYSEACIELCKEMGVKVIDLWSAIQRREDWLTTCFTDGIHLTAEGSEIVVKEILKVLKEAEWTPSLYGESMPIEFAEYSPHEFVPSGGKTTLNPSQRILAYESNL